MTGFLFFKIIYSITDLLVAIVLFKLASTKEASAEEHLANIPMGAV